MALGYHDFAPGEILTATLVDGIMRQTVMTFATTAARDSALSGVLDEGMRVYTTDADRLWYYDGTNWIISGGAWPSCSLTRSVAESHTTTATFEQVDFSASTTEIVDTDAFHGAGATITVPVGFGGDYIVTGWISFAANGTGARGTRVAVTSNSVSGELANIDSTGTNAGAVIGSIFSVTRQTRLEAGAVLELQGYQASGGALNMNATAMSLLMVRHIPTLT